METTCLSQTTILIPLLLWISSSSWHNSYISHKVLFPFLQLPVWFHMIPQVVGDEVLRVLSLVEGERSHVLFVADAPFDLFIRAVELPAYLCDVRVQSHLWPTSGNGLRLYLAHTFFFLLQLFFFFLTLFLPFPALFYLTGYLLLQIASTSEVRLDLTFLQGEVAACLVRLSILIITRFL